MNFVWIKINIAENHYTVHRNERCYELRARCLPSRLFKSTEERRKVVAASKMLPFATHWICGSVAICAKYSSRCHTKPVKQQKKKSDRSGSGSMRVVLGKSRSYLVGLPTDDTTAQSVNKAARAKRDISLFVIQQLQFPNLQVWRVIDRKKVFTPYCKIAFTWW